MHKRLTLVGTCLVVAAIAGFCGETIAVAQAAEDAEASEAVRAANARFYEALNILFTGDAGPMEAVWSHSDDVMYLPPMLERLSGWEAVQASWQAQADLKLGGEVEPHDVVVTMLSSEVALTVTTEMGENPNTPAGPQEVNIRSTKLFRLEDGEWKLIYDHVDLLPDLAGVDS